MEDMRPISGFPHYYVTCDGRVFCDKPDRRWGDALRERTLHTNKKGYLRLSMRDAAGRRRDQRVHRLVALTYIPNPDRLPTVNHIDGDKTNNHVSNLEWATYQRQMRHAVDAGLAGASGIHSARSWRIVKPDGDTITVHNLSQYCREHGLDPSEMSKVMARKPGKKSHKGYRAPNPKG